MPLLQSILTELDRELTRLNAIRKLLAELSCTPALVSRYTAPVVQPVAPAAKEPKRTHRPRVAAGRPRASRTSKVPSTPGALAAAFPSGPVLFNPSRLAEEQARRQQGREAGPALTPEVLPGEDLDALSRSLAARWTTGAVQ